MGGTGHTSVRSYNLYTEGFTPATNIFTDLSLPFIDMADATPFISQGIVITNDNAGGGANVQFSFDGVAIHGTIKPEEILTFDFRRLNKIYIRSTFASPFRFWAW